MSFAINTNYPQPHYTIWRMEPGQHLGERNERRGLRHRAIVFVEGNTLLL